MTRELGVGYFGLDEDYYTPQLVLYGVGSYQNKIIAPNSKVMESPKIKLDWFGVCVGCN